MRKNCVLSNGPCCGVGCTECALINIAGSLSSIMMTLQAIYFAIDGTENDDKDSENSEDLSDRPF